jgi:hypothetical protein
VLWIVKHLVGEPGFNDTTTLHHNHSMCEQTGNGKIVRDDD